MTRNTSPDELASQLKDDVGLVNKAYAAQDVIFAEVLHNGLGDLKEWCEERGLEFGTHRYDGFHKTTYRIEV